jgi:hypothetical protein
VVLFNNSFALSTFKIFTLVGLRKKVFSYKQLNISGQYAVPVLYSG